MTNKSREVKDEEHNARRDVAKGAGSVFLAKTGSAIDIITTPAYTWMFGLATYGFYAVLWSLVSLIERIADLAMTAALQRILPVETDPLEKARVIKAALLLGVLPCIAVAIVISIFTPQLSLLFNVADKDLPQLELSIRLFVWAIPLWAMLEIATAVIRAFQAFGPEIRLRLVWEQLCRLVLAVLLWLAGVDTLALLLAHLGSLIITNIFAMRALHRHCSVGLVIRAKPGLPVFRELALSGLSVLPGNVLSRLFVDAPVVLLNVSLAGAAGANAAGLYSIARKLSSIPQLVRSVFSHVVSPVAASAANRDHHSLQALYTFSIRLSVLLAVPTAVALITAADSILVLFVTGAAAAWPVVVILTLARGLQAALGPASALQQVVSHRGLPVLNSVIGLSVAISVLVFVFPAYGTTGLALAVAAGQTAMILLPVLQLGLRENLLPFDGSFMRILAGALIGCLIIVLVALACSSLPAYIKGLVVFVTYLGVLWSGVRYALPKQDRLALGKLGRHLRLIPG